MSDDTMSSMNCGTVAGGGVELPGSVDQLTPQVGAGGVSSKPLNAAGAVPPESEFAFHHCAPQKVTALPTAPAIGPTVRSPTTNVPPKDGVCVGMLSDACTSAAS